MTTTEDVLHGVDASRRAGWAKYYAALEERDELARDLRVAVTFLADLTLVQRRGWDVDWASVEHGLSDAFGREFSRIYAERERAWQEDEARRGGPATASMCPAGCTHARQPF